MGIEGRVRFPEKVMSHYEKYNLLPYTYRANCVQTELKTDRVNCRGASLLKSGCEKYII